MTDEAMAISDALQSYVRFQHATAVVNVVLMIFIFVLVMRNRRGQP